MSRRLAVAAVLAGALAGAPAADADTAVVNATVFTGSAGTAAARTVALSALDACPAYTGPGTLTMYPGGSTDTLPAGSTWTLAEVLECGLSIPLTDLTAVEVLRPDGAAQRPLSSAALSDPGQYADPAAPGALPVISNDGGQAQNTYTRPWRGGSDENGRDQVTASGPIGLVVYENTAPLTVQIAAHPVRRAAGRERVALSATVQTAAGASVPANALGWQWTLSTGARSAAATPTVTVPRGTATVTVLVSDTATGSGGTASVALTYRPVHSSRARSGGGGHGTVHSTSGLGGSARHPRRGGTDHRRGEPATSTATSTTPTPATDPATSTGSSAPPATSTAATATGTSSTTSATTATTSTTPSSPPRARRPRHSPAHRSPAPDGTLVHGRLLADVVPLGAAQSPLTHPLSSPGAAIASPAPATRITVPAGVIGGLVILGLLALGAAHEQRRRWPRLHR